MNFKDKKILTDVEVIDLVFIMFICCAYLFFCLGLIFSDEVIGRVSYTAHNIIFNESYPNCSNMSLEDTSFCLNNFVRKNFIYNSTDDSINLTISDLLERGGDCKDWTDFYASYFEEYGFKNIKRVRLNITKEFDEESNKFISNRHVFLIVGNSLGYCNIDMTELTCFEYDN